MYYWLDKNKKQKNENKNLIIAIFKVRDLLPRLNYKSANQNGGINTTFERSWADELDLLA